MQFMNDPDNNSFFRSMNTLLSKISCFCYVTLIGCLRIFFFKMWKSKLVQISQQRLLKEMVVPSACRAYAGQLVEDRVTHTGQDMNQLQARTRNREEKLQSLRSRQELEPFGIIVGDLRSPQFFVWIKDILYKVDTLIRTVELLFKAIYALRREYLSLRMRAHLAGSWRAQNSSSAAVKWEADDYRMSRFVDRPKHVNPNFSMKLIAEVPPKACKERVVWCDGGSGPEGHPRVYINLDRPGNHSCGYCGLRFFHEGDHHH